MSDHMISEVSLSDERALSQVDFLLEKEGLVRDANLDCICAVYDDDCHVIGTGSCFGNTLRCFAVSKEHQGEGILNELLTHLINLQYQRGNFHLFLYTKQTSACMFGDLGFHEIARIGDTLVFMENRKNGFRDYLHRLESSKTTGKSAAIVMNANPFTLGHLHLVEHAAAGCDALHLFIVSEDVSFVPFPVRKKLVMDGTAHLKNVIYHDSGSYMISNATFPSYFLKDSALVTAAHAKLDLAIFTEIAKTMNITARYVGEEPKSFATGIYNQVMADALPHAGIKCHIIPRKEYEGDVISASRVREALQNKDMELLKRLVPETTYQYFLSNIPKN